MFLDELFYKTAVKTLPFIAKIALTHDCNLTCRHCYLGPPQGRVLEAGEFKEIITQLARSGVLFLTFTGGEPMMYPGFWEIIEFARRSKFFLRVFTNGTLIDEKAAGLFARYGVNEVHVSLYGHEPGIHELITGIGGSFDKTVNAIQLLKRQGVEIQVKSSIMTLNWEYAAKIENFCCEMGVKCSFSYLLSPRTDGSEEPCQLQCDIPETDPGCLPVFPEVSAGDRPSPCPAGENSLFIEYDGTLYPCVNFRYPIGNLNEMLLNKLWNSNEMIEVRTGKVTPSHCTNCIAIGSCLRCPGLSYHESGRKDGYSIIQCRQTRILLNMKERSGIINEGIC